MARWHPGLPNGEPGAAALVWRLTNYGLSLVVVVASLVSAPRASLVFVLPALLCIGLEGLAPLRPTRRRWATWLTDLTHVVGNRVMIAAGLALSLGALRSVVGLLPVSLSQPVELLPPPVAFIVVFVVTDAVNYSFHRLSHEWRPLWRLHRVHHSSSHLDWLATSRGHALDQILAFTAVTAPGIVLGRPTFAAFSAAVLYYWPFVCHANIAWSGGRLDRVFITPRAHHWHHGLEAAAVNRNYGAVLSLWDRLLGTWVNENRYPTAYGTTDLPDRPDYLEHLLSPLYIRANQDREHPAVIRERIPESAA